MKQKNIFLSCITFIFFIAGIFFAGCGSTGGAQKEIFDLYKGPNFRVDRTRILDLDGNEFTIKGVNVNGPGWVWYDPPTMSYLEEQIIDAWKFNTIRLAMSLGWNFSLNNPSNTNNAALDDIIDLCTSKKIVCILTLVDWMNLIPPEEGAFTSQDRGVWIPGFEEYSNWWKETALKYRENPYVWFNVIAEPGNKAFYNENDAALWYSPEDSAASWYESHDKIIKTIRLTGANNIIVLDDHDMAKANFYQNGRDSWDSAVIRMGPELLKKYGNLVFSVHTYGHQDSWTVSRIRNYFGDAKELGLCMAVGEYALGQKFPADSTPAIAPYSTFSALWNYMLPNGIGRIWWSWDDWQYPLTKSGAIGANGYPDGGGRGYNMDKSDGTKPGNLSYAGSIIWDDNHGVLLDEIPPAAAEERTLYW